MRGRRSIRRPRCCLAPRFATARVARYTVSSAVIRSEEVPLESLLYISLALFGLLFGSFANVVIWRFPRGESLSLPGLSLPRLRDADRLVRQHPRRFVGCARRQMPVVRHARSPVRYPIVELLSAVLWVLAGVVFGVSLQTAAAVFFFYLLLILSFIDLDVRRLPNALVGSAVRGRSRRSARFAVHAVSWCLPLLCRADRASGASPSWSRRSGAVACRRGDAR